jgi:hypothetical protein
MPDDANRLSRIERQLNIALSVVAVPIVFFCIIHAVLTRTPEDFLRYPSMIAAVLIVVYVPMGIIMWYAERPR